MLTGTEFATDAVPPSAQGRRESPCQLDRLLPRSPIRHGSDRWQTGATARTSRSRAGRAATSAAASPARACRATPNRTQRSQAEQACANKAATTPVSTSLCRRKPCPDCWARTRRRARGREWPLSRTATAAYAASSRTAACPVAGSSATSHPSRRAASPGCGVSTMFPANGAARRRQQVQCVGVEHHQLPPVLHGRMHRPPRILAEGQG